MFIDLSPFVFCDSFVLDHLLDLSFKMNFWNFSYVTDTGPWLYAEQILFLSLCCPFLFFSFLFLIKGSAVLIEILHPNEIVSSVIVFLAYCLRNPFPHWDHKDIFLYRVRDLLYYKTQNIYSLALYRKSLLMYALRSLLIERCFPPPLLEEHNVNPVRKYLT